MFLSPPIRGQPRNGVSVTSRSPFSVMGDRPSSVGGEERSLSVGGDLGKKCNMLIYPSRYRGGDPRGCVLELIGFPVSQSGGPQGSFRASRHLQAPQMESGGPQGSNRVCRPSGSQGVWRPCSTPEDLETPPDTPNRVRRLSEVDQGLQTPPDTSRHPNRVWSSGVAQGRAEARWGRQGPGRRSKGPWALSTPRGRDLDSPCVLG